MTENHVIIYSNGIADFQRCYAVGVGATQQISIPVRQDHLADVLASFNVFGNVKLASPPTFRPSNELEGNLSISPANVLESLARDLSGTQVRVERVGGTVEGTLVGLHQEQEANTGEPVEVKSVIVLAADGLRRCPLREIQSLQFLDEDVQQEISKGLQRNYQRIKPNSTFVELELSAAEESAEAIVQYTIPAAAWKISYRLRMAEERAAELQGFAIVDNNTDEDWTDFRVSVVTGEPITFTTDLAESKSPARKHVNLVADTALGAVELAAHEFGEGAGIDDDTSTLFHASIEGQPPQKLMARSRLSSLASRSTAETPSADVREVGDFSVFESQSTVTIPAQRSTVIPVFNLEVAEVKRVLHYKEANHPERPYRSIDFTNTATFSLARGVCTVFEEGAYAGSCIMPALKTDESRLLPHALETGVTVRHEPREQRGKVVALRLSEGFCYTSTRQRRKTHYHITNNRDQQFQLYLDHVFNLREPETEATLRRDGNEEPLAVHAKISGGLRFMLELPPKSTLTITVTEQRIDSTQVQIVSVSKTHENLQIGWIEDNLVKANGPLASDPAVLSCLRIQRELESQKREISNAVQETERLAERQERLRQNIKTGGQDELTNRWRKELDEAEQAIRSIEEEQLPGLRTAEQALRSRLREALQSLSAEWSDAGISPSQ